MSSNYLPVNLTPLQEERFERVMCVKTPKGGWKNRDLLELGINTPPKSGWLRRFVLNGPDFEPITKKQLGLLGEIDENNSSFTSI